MTAATAAPAAPPTPESAAAAWTYDPEVHRSSRGADYYEPEFETKVLDGDDVLLYPIRSLLRAQAPEHEVPESAPIYLVTHAVWSGYSEYTITDQWDEVHVHAGGVDLHWNDMGAFMRDLAAANPPDDDR